jgi:hypothetical protein
VRYRTRTNRRTAEPTVTYCFRIRFRLGTTSRIESEADELLLVPADQGAERVVLRPRDGLRLRDATELVLRGEGYGNREEAEEAASRWGARLRVAFAQLRIGADFGLRAPHSAFTPPKSGSASAACAKRTSIQTARTTTRLSGRSMTRTSRVDSSATPMV